MESLTCHSDLAGPPQPHSASGLPTPTPSVTTLAIEPAGPEESWGVHGDMSFLSTSLSLAWAGLAVLQALLSCRDPGAGLAGRETDISPPIYLQCPES